MTANRSVRSHREVSCLTRSLKHPDYFAEVASETILTFGRKKSFQFQSSVHSPWAENNVVPGQLFRVNKVRPGEGAGPAVLLVHGWNGEQGYRFLFPLLARRFRQLGITVAMIELPYHGSRKPRSGQLRNFLSGDIVHMMEATRQAIADIRAMLEWLRAEGHGSVGLWGVSLGAWLAGLVACAEDELGAAVLLTPVPNLDEAIANLEFCRHIRASMEALDISATDLSLTSHQPKLAPENILIVESLYDLFAPANSVEDLWEAWNRPEIWRVKHGHISVLFSVSIMERTGRWLRRRLLAAADGNS